MALITRSSPSIDLSSILYRPGISGLLAGEDLDIAAPCYLKTGDGKIWMSNATAVAEAAEVLGFCARAVNSGEPVTLFGVGAIFHYAAASTFNPGDKVYVGATKGRLDTVAQVGDAIGVAIALSDKDILVVRDFAYLVSTAVRLKAAAIAGAVAGNHAVTGMVVKDLIVKVFNLSTAASIATITDVTSEYATYAGGVNNGGGTTSNGDTLLVIYYDMP